MTLRWNVTWIALACTGIAAGSLGCRKDRPRSAEGDAGAATPTAVDEKAGGTAAPGTPATAPEDVDWMGIGNDEVARRSNITADECAIALADGQGVRITVCDFIREVNSLPGRYRARFDSLERRKELLDDMISMVVMEAEAKRLGLDQGAEAQMAVERILADKMEAKIRDELRAGIREAITDADVQQYYDGHQDQFSRPELASAAHIVVAQESRAREIIAQLTAPGTDPTTFAKVALEESTDQETRTRGGNLAFFTRPDVHSELYRSVDPAIATVVFEMQNVGQIHPEPIHTAAGWEVVKLMGKRAPIVRTLDQVRAMIRSRIEEERLEEAWKQRLTEIEAELGVELHPENLTDVRPNIPSQEELRALHDARMAPTEGVGPVPSGRPEVLLPPVPTAPPAPAAPEGPAQP